MALSTEAVGLAYLLTGGGLLLLLREPLRRPDKPGSPGFALAVVGISAWPLGNGVNYFVAGLDASLALWTLRLLAASVISVGWFLVAADVTNRLSLSRSVAAAAVSYAVVELALVATNPAHGLVYGPATALDGTIPVVAYGPWFWTQTVINYGLILAGTALLAAEWSQSSGLRRRQTAALTVAVVPPAAANLLTILGGVSTVHDLTPFGLIGSGLLLSWALYRAEFLDIVPVARQVAMAEMQDAVVTLDDEGRVVDCNRAARSLFDIPPSYAGDPVEAHLPALADSVDAVRAPAAVDLLTTDVDGESHSFSVSVSPVVERGETVASVVVLRDITPIKRRERKLEEREAELDLLRQILSRVLRHNIRNKLTAIRGNADLLAGSVDDPDDAARVETIVDASDGLIALSEKARTIESLVDRAGETVTYDLRAVAERAVEEVRRQHPDAAYEIEGAADCRVVAGPGLDAAVRCLVENAVAHNGGNDPRVRLTVDCEGDRRELRVADNGPGIPGHELTVLERDEETPLAHSSGIGLWIVSWTADRADADLSFDVDDEGTTVSIRFPADA